MPLHLDLDCAPPALRRGCAQAGLGLGRAADGDRTWLGQRCRECAWGLVAAAAAADVHAAIGAAAGCSRVAARRSANMAQYRLTPGLNIPSPH